MCAFKLIYGIILKNNNVLNVYIIHSNKRRKKNDKNYKKDLKGSLRRWPVSFDKQTNK